MGNNNNKKEQMGEKLMPALHLRLHLEKVEKKTKRLQGDVRSPHS